MSDFTYCWHRPGALISGAMRKCRLCGVAVEECPCVENRMVRKGCTACEEQAHDSEGGDGMSERDPRCDPRPGDVLRKGPFERRVSSRWHTEEYDDRIFFNESLQSNLLSEWRKWAATATVVKRGEA